MTDPGALAALDSSGRVPVFPATANSGGAVHDDASPDPFTTPEHVTVHDGTEEESDQ